VILPRVPARFLRPQAQVTGRRHPLFHHHKADGSIAQFRFTNHAGPNPRAAR
jgi:hypothetical protein